MQFIFYFYFQKIGNFPHFPTKKWVDRIVVGKAPATVLKVMRT